MDIGEFYGSFTHIYARVTRLQPTYQALMKIHADELIGRQRLLESGCGHGDLAIRLADQGSLVYAIDENYEGLSILEKNVGKRHICIQKGDVNHIPVSDESFDGVSSSLVLMFMRDPIKYLVENRRVLKKGGVFVVSGPDEGAKNVDYIFDRWERDLIDAGKFSQVAEDWCIFKEKLRQSAAVNIRNWYSSEELAMTLDLAGFCVNKIMENPQFYGRGYVIVAEKIDF